MKHTLLLLLLILSSCSKSNQTPVQAANPAATAPIEVQAVSAEERNTDKSILVTGSLLPDDTVTVVTEVPGKIATIKVDFGQSIRKGEIIAEMEKTEAQLQLEKTRGALSQALARVGMTLADANVTPTNTPAMRQARAQMEDARFKFENAQKLIKSGDISQERFNEADKAFRAREAAYEATRDDMRTQWASVESLRAELGLVEKKLRDTVIRAPFDGTVSERKVSPGQYVKDNVPVVTLVKTNPMRLRAEIPESASAVVRTGTSLEFMTEAVPGKTFQAIVREINPGLSEQSRTLIVEARLNVNEPALRPGMFVQIKLLLERNVKAVVVPRRAVYSVAGLTKVFVVRDGKLVERRIPPGEMIGDWMEVPADQVKTGDSVVVNNLAQLSDGQQVRITGRS